MKNSKISKHPLVSVVVNNYNNEKYLSECLTALINQTYKNIEIVVVDAFSTDNSRAIISNFERTYKNLKVIFSDFYIKYPAISYNLGFLNCSADFIAINDPDDISLPTRIEKQIKFLMENPDVEVVGCNIIEFNEKFSQRVYTTVENNIKNANPPVRNPTLMFRKIAMASYGVWNWKSEYAADFEWLYRWYCGGAKFFILDECLVKYRYNYGTNISSVNSINQAFKLTLFRLYFGLKLIKTTKLNWWLKTIDSLYYFLSLTVKAMVKKKFK